MISLSFPRFWRLKTQSAQAQLLKRAQGGEREAIAVLLNRHRASVARLATAILHDPELAQDAAQDALVRAFQKLPSFRAESEFSTWLTRLTVNVCLETARQQKRRERLCDPQIEPREDGFARQLETRSAVAHCLENLGESLQITLVLRECSGYSYEEIAQITRVPVGTVRSRLNEARRQFKIEWARLERQTEEATR